MSGVLNVLMAGGVTEVYSAYLTNDTYSSSVAFPSRADAGIMIASDGYVYSYTTELGYVQQYQWLTGDGTAADYQAWQDITPSGMLCAGSDASETWINCGSSPTWFACRSVVGTTTSYYWVKIRAVSTLGELASCNIILSTTVT